MQRLYFVPNLDSRTLIAMQTHDAHIMLADLAKF